MTDLPYGGRPRAQPGDWPAGTIAQCYRCGRHIKRGRPYEQGPHAGTFTHRGPCLLIEGGGEPEDLFDAVERNQAIADAHLEEAAKFEAKSAAHKLHAQASIDHEKATLLEQALHASILAELDAPHRLACPACGHVGVLHLQGARPCPECGCKRVP